MLRAVQRCNSHHVRSCVAGPSPAIVAPTGAVRHFSPLAPAQDAHTATYEHSARRATNELDSGLAEYAPRAVGDFKMDTPDQVIPGSHPLPLSNGNTESLLWPLASPYMPSPRRDHPYFTAPVEEFPHFECSVPIVYPAKVLKTPIIAPVFETANGTISHTRQLDPFVFGQYPHMNTLSRQAEYWIVRNQNYANHWELQHEEIFRKAKKNWPNTGTGLQRVNTRRGKEYLWGGRIRANKPWNAKMPRADPTDWHTACRMALALKVLQGKVQIVDRLTLPEPTTAAFRDLCDRMQWDVRSTGAGVLFMDGGSRLTPSLEFNRNFFYGSFINGKVKLVRPTIRIAEPFDWNLRGTYRDTFHGPQGQKNPVPINRFNIYDALDHHLLVMTEGAVLQLEREMFSIKVAGLPPHIRNAMADSGMLEHHLLGNVAAPLEPVELEAAGRTEEREKAMYEGYYDNPYRPWADEDRAAYVVDERSGYIKRDVIESSPGDEQPRPGSWRKIQ